MPRAKYEDLVEKHLEVTLRSGNEYMVRCIEHDDSSASMQINVETGLWLCFSCGARGNIKRLMKYLGLRYEEPEVDVNDLLARIDALRKPDADPLPVKSESYLKRFAIPTKLWEERGIGKVAQATFDLGYDPLENFLTIPIRNVNGGLLGVIRRYMDDDIPSNLRYRYPKGFKRSNNLFASWLVEHDPDADTVVLVEGSLDAIPIWQAGHPAMAVYGSSINPAQVRLLRRLGIGKVILFFDNDVAGKKATKSCFGIHYHRRGEKVVKEYRPETDLRREFIVETVRYPRKPMRDRHGKFISDPGAMNSEQIELMLTNAARAT